MYISPYIYIYIHIYIYICIYIYIHRWSVVQVSLYYTLVPKQNNRENIPAIRGMFSSVAGFWPTFIGGIRVS